MPQTVKKKKSLLRTPSSGSAIKMPFQELPEASAGLEEAFCSLSERNVHGVGRAGSFYSPSSPSLAKLPWMESWLPFCLISGAIQRTSLLWHLLEKCVRTRRQVHSPEFPKIKQVRIAM